ncbi:hypothetical protein Patl1_06354 [Pistacia atlantica]|uniref:Uncharacterized protein n=1 Tax=Pistacia atlantica TaxID=434234 RepID=A0ACC1BX68_9ROSI|nr:hypothetical protein Patl1_06354 [Pistacia atlantica]
MLLACYIQNRIPFKKTDKTPYKLWKGHVPNLKYFKVSGCFAKVLTPEPKRKRLGPRTVDCMFVGYAQNSAAYRFMVIKQEVGLYDANTIIESKNAYFFENIFPKKINCEKALPQNETFESSPQNETLRNSSKSSELEIRRSKRVRKAKSYGDDYYVFLTEDDPQTYKEAMTSRDASLWKEAVNNEIESIMSNHTWEIVNLRPGTKPIGCKWIFKKKLKTDGSIEKYKVRLVAKGYTQKKDIDYFDTYAPVTRIASIRVLIALAAIYKLHIHQMDVKIAFLNGDLDEEIYIKQPKGSVIPSNEHKLCKLVKSLYGLKQAPKQWHEKFDQVLLSNGYTINDSDKCVYSKSYEDNTYVIICLYVDDMLIFSANMDVIIKNKKFLASNFDMKDMGEANVILGINIIKINDGLKLSQQHYVENFLRKFGYLESKLVSTPYDGNTQLKKNTQHSVSQNRYTQIIGSLMYLMNSTRPDIAYVVTRLSRYTHNPDKSHWIALDRVARYLKGTIDYGLMLGSTPPVLEGYSNANWISDSDEIKSTSGYIFTLGGGVVSWKSSKQTCIAQSTMESELIALEKACSEAEWLRNFLADLPIETHPPILVSIHCDCQAAIARAKSKIYNGKSRHIRIRHTIIKQLLESGVVSLDFVKSELNLADPLTKPLSRRLVEYTSRGMGLMPKP